MRGTADALEGYLSDVANLLERMGVTVRGPADIALLEDADGHLSFELVGDLPDGGRPARSEVAIREVFEPEGPDQYGRTRYEYELIDRERDFRRAFHLHSPDWFERRYLVVVHEHCERPLGTIDCEHYHGTPIKDAFGGIHAILDAWTADPPECSDLRCLD